jgi:CheY-like chemotaxis protein
MKKGLKKIMVIDDNDVAEAWDGRMGLDTARREKPDLILLDILMPNMDGKEFVRNLRRDPELKDTPVIFITVCIDLEKDKGHETIEVDGIHYPGFAKPLHNARLLSLIRKTLNRRANSISGAAPADDSDE